MEYHSYSTNLMLGTWRLEVIFRHLLMILATVLPSYAHVFTGYKLSDAGYDVWMGNLRGTIYSARHKNFSNTEPEFWNYR